MLHPGDVISLPAGQKAYQWRPWKGGKSWRTSIRLGDAMAPAGRYVVTKATVEGVGGHYDPHPDAYHVFLEYQADRAIKIEVYQAGEKGAMLPPDWPVVDHVALGAS